MTVENFSECCPNHSTFNKRNATFFKVKYFSIKLVVRHCVFELQFCCYITWTFKLFLAHYCVFNPRNLTKNIKEYIYRIEETTGSRWRSDLRWNRRVKCRTAAILKSSHPGISTQSYTITNRPGPPPSVHTQMGSSESKGNIFTVLVFYIQHESPWGQLCKTSTTRSSSSRQIPQK